MFSLNAMMVSTLCVAFCFAGITVMATSVLDKPHYDLQDTENLFKDFLKEYKKTYSGKEYKERLEIFKASIIDINQRNAMFPETVFKVNHFADMRPDELARYRGFKLPNATRVKLTIPDTPVAAPDELDWRKMGVVSHVKNQGDCGSCFIFGAVGNIEGQYALKHNECIALSEQQALDCLAHGTCDGGYGGEIMEDFATRAGVMREDYYPYLGHQQYRCHENANGFVAVVKGGSVINIPDEEVLKKKLVELGPLDVALNADDFHSYQNGILKPSACIEEEDDHEVLLVGYGEENGTKFWILKNSWGTSWGESGYVRLERGVKACGIGLSYTASATVA